MLLNWAEHATPNVFASAARLYSAMRLADRHRPIANLVISNVPGPDFPLYLGGAEMKAGFPLGPVMEGMGVNITVMSYRGILNWGIIACPESIPRLWSLIAAVPRALDELLEAAGQEPAHYRSEEAAAAVRASGPGPRPARRLNRPGGAGCRAWARSGCRGHRHRGRPRAHRDGRAEGRGWPAVREDHA